VREEEGESVGGGLSVSGQKLSAAEQRAADHASGSAAKVISPVSKKLSVKAKFSTFSM
jgi:hypothetical protein